MLESLLKKRRKAKSSLNLTLFWISNHGTMRRVSTNSKNASDQSLWTDFFGVPENSLQSGKNLIFIFKCIFYRSKLSFILQENKQILTCKNWLHRKSWFWSKFIGWIFSPFLLLSDEKNRLSKFKLITPKSLHKVFAVLKNRPKFEMQTF